MNRRRLIPLVTGLVLSVVVTACASSSFSPTHDGSPYLPDRATVDHAASLAFGKPSTCGKPDRYGEYICAEHPQTCDVQTDGSIDASAANAGCWETICDAELGVATSRPDTGTEDFYYCEREVAGCSSVTGGCPGHDVCVTGHGRKLVIDAVRTEELPDQSGSEEFSCPFHDEG